jgi:hypothetical protein
MATGASTPSETVGTLRLRLACWAMAALMTLLLAATTLLPLLKPLEFQVGNHGFGIMAHLYPLRRPRHFAGAEVFKSSANGKETQRTIWIGSYYHETWWW